MSKYYQYYVEGECEEKLIRVLKEQKNLIISGKVQVFNPIQQKFKTGNIRALNKNTVVILVFDTDKPPGYLDENISFLKNSNNIKDVLCVTQVHNLEDELLRATNVSKIKDITKSPTDKEFKRDMIKASNFFKLLTDVAFSIDKLWTLDSDGLFSKYKNQSFEIKL